MENDALDAPWKTVYHYFRKWKINGTPSTTTILADRGFLGKEKQVSLKEKKNILLLKQKKNHNQPNPYTLPKIYRKTRQLIETVNSQLTERFGVQKIRAKKGGTFFAKWYIKILSHTVCVYINLQLGRSPLDFAGLVSI